jgi:type IV pilus assembly protein PilY1
MRRWMMVTSKVDRLRAQIVIAIFFMTLFIASPVMAGQPCAVDPATGGANILPNVLLLFDNSYSMNLYANVDKSGSTIIVYYNKDKTYSGIFSPGARYNYIGDATNLTNTGYFEQSDTGDWSGNFLNWVTALRVDVARKVLTGGRPTTDYQYITSNTKVNFVDGYEASDPLYLSYVNKSIVPRPYPYTSSPVTANQVPSTFGTDGATYPSVHYYYTNIGNSGTNQWSRLLVKITFPSDFDTNHNPVTGDHVYNIRIKVASSNLKGLLDDLADKVRLGLMHFNSGNEGGYIVNYVKKLGSSQLTAIKDNLNRSLADTWTGAQTPLAETMYEAARFFGQQTARFSGYTRPTFDASGNCTSSPSSLCENDPLYYVEWGKRLGCGKNYVIIVTDGESTEDRSTYLSTDNIPGTTIKIKDAYPDKSNTNRDCDDTPSPCTSAYDGCGYYLSSASPPLCSSSSYPFCTSGTTGCNYGNGSTYLDDVAYMAKTYPFRSLGNPAMPVTVTTHTVYMFGTGSGVADTLLHKTADRGGGYYYTANNAEDLKDNLFQIFSIITNVAAAAASTAITSEPVSGVDLIYIPYYTHPSDSQWRGNVRAFRMGTDGSLLQGGTGTDKATDTDNDLVLDNPKWDATLQLQAKAGTTDSRTIYTYIPGKTNPYLFNLSHTSDIGWYFDANLNKDSTYDEIGANKDVNPLISYTRGNDAPSGFTAALLRDRQNMYIGDIMHANPVFVGKPSARYDLIYGDESYRDFYWTDSVQNRTQVIYAPANDGMLHCFDAASGAELWAYIPYNLLPHLKWLTDPNYGTCHTYYLDLTANVWDMKIGSDWKSIVVGGMRLGGTPQQVDTDNNGSPDTWLRSAFFALDVTDPNSFNFLWELNDDRFGYTVSKPIPVKVGSNWYLVFGSGPKSVKGEGAPSPAESYTDMNGYIFVVDPSDGSTTTISLGTLGAGNFFGSPVAIDYDMDYSVDMIYIGDAKGNLWRIKTFTEAGATKTYQSSGSWAIDVSGTAGISNPQPLLSLGTDQPIVMKPTVSMDEKGRVWIYFGTGRYYCAGDNDYCGVGNVCPTTSGGCTFTDTGSLTRSKYIAVGVYDWHWATDKFVLQSSTINFAADNAVLDHRVIKQGTVVGSLEPDPETGETSSTSTSYYIVDASTGEIDTDVSTNGWYFHLLDAKERSLGDYLVYQRGLFFISFEPNTTDPCSNNGGLSYLYGVNYMSGTSAAESMFDLTGEGKIDYRDLVRDADTDRGGVLIQLRTGYAGGGLKIKLFDGNPMGYTPLPEDKLTLNPPGETYNTGVTSWREVWQ